MALVTLHLATFAVSEVKALLSKRQLASLIAMKIFMLFLRLVMQDYCEGRGPILALKSDLFHDWRHVGLDGPTRKLARTARLKRLTLM